MCLCPNNVGAVGITNRYFPKIFLKTGLGTRVKRKCGSFREFFFQIKVLLCKKDVTGIYTILNSSLHLNKYVHISQEKSFAL